MDADAIKMLAEAIRAQTVAASEQGHTQQNSQVTVAAVAFKAPQFWATNAKAWFLRLEAAFATHHPPITQDLTKFQHVVTLLDSAAARRVQAVMENPPLTDKYETLKSALLNAFEATQLQKDCALLSMNGLGDRKPSELLQHMKSQNTDPRTLFRALFLNQLPAEVRRIVAQSPELDLDALAATADRIMESDLISPVISNINNDDLEAEISQVNAVNTNFARQKGPPKTVRKKFSLCKYHSQFGHEARRCEQFIGDVKCAFYQSGKSGNGNISKK